MPEPRVLVLHGEDRFSRDEEVRRLKAEQRALPAGEHNLDEVRGEEIDLPRLFAICGSAPFLAERRLVIAHGLLSRSGGNKREARGGKKKASADPGQDSSEQLQAGLAALPPTTLLVLVENGMDARRLEALLPRDASRVVAFPRPVDAELDVWIRKRARARGLTLREEALSALARLGDEDLGRLDAEISKLADYADGAPVGIAEVRLLGVARDEHIFALLDAVTDGKSGPALRVLRALFEQGQDPHVILPQLVGLIRRLIVAREAAVQRLRVEDLARDHDLNPRALTRLSTVARQIPASNLDQALQRALDTDRALKTGRQDEEAALELLVGRVSALLRGRE